MFSAPSGAAYSGEMIFRRCRSHGAFRNRGNFLQRFRSWRSLNTRNLPQRRRGAKRKSQRDSVFNSKLSRCFLFQFLKVTD
jgi:hypothetical protein